MYTVVNGFVCPSDLPSTVPSLGAQTNYMANMGSGIVWQSAIGPNVGLPQPNGVFYGDSATTFAAITDGLSNTTFYSERVLADGNNSIVSPIADVFFSPAFPTTPDQAMQMCQAVDITNLGNQFPLFMGAPWLCGQHIFLHVTPPNSRSCGFFISLAGRDAAQQPPSRRREHALRRRVGQVRQGLGQSLGLACSGNSQRRRGYQRRQLLSIETKKREINHEHERQERARPSWPGSPGPIEIRASMERSGSSPPAWPCWRRSSSPAVEIPAGRTP